MQRWLIFNPEAGSASPERRATLEAYCTRHPGTQLHCTAEAGDARRIARDAAMHNIAMVVSVGGDGTLHEVINGLLSHGSATDAAARPILGILPGGTGNDLCRTLDLPRDLDEALLRLDAGRDQPLDVIHVEPAHQPACYMHNAATGAFSTVVAEKLDKQDKRLWGALSYLKAGIAALGEVEDYQLSVSFDDDPVQELSSCALAVANGRYAGGGLAIAPDAKPDDGWLDVLITTACSTGERIETIANFLLHRPEQGANMLVRPCRRVRIEATPKLSFMVDGEPLAETPVSFTVVPGALRVRV